MVNSNSRGHPSSNNAVHASRPVPSTNSNSRINPSHNTFQTSRPVSTDNRLNQVHSSSNNGIHSRPPFTADNRNSQGHPSANNAFQANQPSLGHSNSLGQTTGSNGVDFGQSSFNEVNRPRFGQRSTFSRDNLDGTSDNFFNQPTQGFTDNNNNQGQTDVSRDFRFREPAFGTTNDQTSTNLNNRFRFDEPSTFGRNSQINPSNSVWPRQSGSFGTSSNNQLQPTTGNNLLQQRRFPSSSLGQRTTRTFPR